MNTSPAAALTSQHVDTIAAHVHADFLRHWHAHHVTTRTDQRGEELMVPYADLSPGAREDIQVQVRSVVDGIRRAGGVIIPPPIPRVEDRS